MLAVIYSLVLKYLLSACHVPDTVLGLKEQRKQNASSFRPRALPSMGETDNKHSSCFSWLTSVNPQSPPESGVRLQIWKPGLTWTGLVRACARVHAQWYPSLCDPIDCSPPASSVRGLSQAGILELVAISSSKGSSQPQGLNPHFLHWQADSLPLHHLGNQTCPRPLSY